MTQPTARSLALAREALRFARCINAATDVNGCRYVIVHGSPHDYIIHGLDCPNRDEAESAPRIEEIANAINQLAREVRAETLEEAAKIYCSYCADGLPATYAPHLSMYPHSWQHKGAPSGPVVCFSSPLRALGIATEPGGEGR